MSATSNVSSATSNASSVPRPRRRTLAATLDKMASEAMDSTHRYAGSFEPAEGIKEEPLNPSHPNGKALKVSATLDNK